MSTYFSPLRRKVGVVMLLMTCVFMVGWLKSRWVYECACFKGTERVHVFCSHQTYVTWTARNGDCAKCYQTIPKDGDLFEVIVKSIRAERHWTLLGFHDIKGNVGLGSFPIAMWIVPYWSIVIPLTAISAWLLLSKPRTKIDPPFSPASEVA